MRGVSIILQTLKKEQIVCFCVWIFFSFEEKILSEEKAESENENSLCELEFLSDPGQPEVRELGPVVTDSETLLRLCWYDSGSILADHAKGAIEGNEAMQVM